MNAQPHDDRAPDLSCFARLVIGVINAGAFACEMALLAPSQPRPVEPSARPASSSPGSGGMRTVGAGR